MTRDDYKLWCEFAAASITGVLSGRLLSDMNDVAARRGSVTTEAFRESLGLLACGMADVLLAEALKRKPEATP